MDPALSTGLEIVLPPDGGVLGRTSEIALPGSTISRQHALLTPNGDGWMICALTSSNAVFFGTERLDTDRPYPLSLGQHFQVGGVVCVLAFAEGTTPVLTPLATDDDAFLLSAQDDGGQCTIYTGRTILIMSPQTSQVLTALMRRPHETVHRWDLLEQIGAGGNLDKVVSNLRGVLVEALLAGSLRRPELLDELRSCQSRPIDGLDDAALIKLMVQTRRGHGYVLNLRAQTVKTELL